MRLTCVTDNSVQRGSPLWGEHGLSFWVQVPEGNMLWDVGGSAEVLWHNLRALELAAQPLHALALSHAHHDHTGALAATLANRPGLPVYANAALFEPRYSRSSERVRSIGLSGETEWRSRAEFRLAGVPQEILPGITTTGLVAPRPYPQGASRGHVVERGGMFHADPYADDMSLVLRVEGGIALLCGCCHAGLRNTLLSVRSHHDEPLVAIFGGTHLADAAEEELAALVETLAREGSPWLYLNHCTGERALYVLQRAFGERVLPCPAGTVVDLG